MVSWYRQRLAVNEETGQSTDVYTKLSEWDDELYPTLYFEYFEGVPKFNTFTEVFGILSTLDSSEGLDEEII